MSVKRYAAKRDANEPAIVKALRDVGATVQQLSETGCPDLLVGFRGVNLLMEVKDEDGRLTPYQKTWHGDWRGQVCVVRTIDEALTAIGAIDDE